VSIEKAREWIERAQERIHPTNLGECTNDSVHSAWTFLNEALVELEAESELAKCREEADAATALAIKRGKDAQQLAEALEQCRQELAECQEKRATEADFMAERCQELEGKLEAAQAREQAVIERLREYAPEDVMESVWEENPRYALAAALEQARSEWEQEKRDIASWRVYQASSDRGPDKLDWVIELRDSDGNVQNRIVFEDGADMEMLADAMLTGLGKDHETALEHARIEGGKVGYKKACVPMSCGHPRAAHHEDMASARCSWCESLERARLEILKQATYRIEEAEASSLAGWSDKVYAEWVQFCQRLDARIKWELEQARREVLEEARINVSDDLAKDDPAHVEFDMTVGEYIENMADVKAEGRREGHKLFPSEMRLAERSGKEKEQGRWRPLLERLLRAFQGDWPNVSVQITEGHWTWLPVDDETRDAVVAARNAIREVDDDDDVS
jgi:hypothetical protein